MRRQWVLALLLVGVSVLVIPAQELLTLTAPVIKPSTNTYHVATLVLDWDDARIIVTLVADNGERLVHQYAGTTATTLMRALNKANLSTRSLNQRIFDRLIADGVLSGSVAGTVP